MEEYHSPDYTFQIKVKILDEFKNFRLYFHSSNKVNVFSLLFSEEAILHLKDFVSNLQEEKGFETIIDKDENENPKISFIIEYIKPKRCLFKIAENNFGGEEYTVAKHLLLGEFQKILKILTAEAIKD